MGHRLAGHALQKGFKAAASGHPSPAALDHPSPADATPHSSSGGRALRVGKREDGKMAGALVLVGGEYNYVVGAGGEGQVWGVTSKVVLLGGTRIPCTLSEQSGERRINRVRISARDEEFRDYLEISPLDSLLHDVSSLLTGHHVPHCKGLTRHAICNLFACVKCVQESLLVLP